MERLFGGFGWELDGILMVGSRSRLWVTHTQEFCGIEHLHVLGVYCKSLRVLMGSVVTIV